MGRRIICTDVHGCFFSLKNLLEECVKLKPQDTLYFLGDAINKGPFSKEVLDYFMDMQQNLFDVHFLRGNHEQELLKVISGQASLDDFISKGGETLLRNFEIQHPRELPEKYIKFIRSFHYYFKLPECYLVHAGFNFNLSNPFIESEEMLVIRDYEVDFEKTQNRFVLHGHSPTDLKQVMKSLETKNSRHYSLDAGCVYSQNHDQAHLVALDLDQWECYVQPNIDYSANYSA